MSIRIAMWSGPRNISTAMMRSFSSRADCAVTDEPFYGAFLKMTGEPHAGAAEIIAAMDCDWQSVAQAMRGPAPDGAAIWYQKHMPHHMVGPLDILDFPDHRHAFLIRDPALVAASYAAKNELVNAEQLGFAKLANYHRRLADVQGVAAPVVDSNAILADPAGQMAALCEALSLAWDPAMLQWPMGRHPADGIWAPHWYGAVWQSTGFGEPTALQRLSDVASNIADQCRADYDYLCQYALQPQGSGQ